MAWRAANHFVAERWTLDSRRALEWRRTSTQARAKFVRGRTHGGARRRGPRGDRIQCSHGRRPSTSGKSGDERQGDQPSGAIPIHAISRVRALKSDRKGGASAPILKMWPLSITMNRNLLTRAALVTCTIFVSGGCAPSESTPAPGPGGSGGGAAAAGRSGPVDSGGSGFAGTTGTSGGSGGGPGTGGSGDGGRSTGTDGGGGGGGQTGGKGDATATGGRGVGGAVGTGGRVGSGGIGGSPGTAGFSGTSGGSCMGPIASATTWDQITASHNVPSWLKSAKLGIQIHWGLYAVPAYHNERYIQHMYCNPSIQSWHKQHFPTRPVVLPRTTAAPRSRARIPAREGTPAMVAPPVPMAAVARRTTPPPASATPADLPGTTVAPPSRARTPVPPTRSVRVTIASVRILTVPAEQAVLPVPVPLPNARQGDAFNVLVRPTVPATNSAQATCVSLHSPVEIRCLK